MNTIVELMITTSAQTPLIIGHYLNVNIIIRIKIPHRIESFHTRVASKTGLRHVDRVIRPVEWTMILFHFRNTFYASTSCDDEQG